MLQQLLAFDKQETSDKASQGLWTVTNARCKETKPTPPPPPDLDQYYFGGSLL